MDVLVINSGSSSIKFRLYDANTSEAVASGIVARIGDPTSSLSYESTHVQYTRQLPVRNHNEALDHIVGALLDQQSGSLASPYELQAVGHRVVHGGASIGESVLIDDDVIRTIEGCVPIAPLHNPVNLACILQCRHLLPRVPQVAVFDTAFHQTMPPKAFMYAIPYQLYETYGIRRYGFHGSSFRYVAKCAAEMVERSLAELKIVACHLGNGASVAAIEAGNSVDTSMGMTPLEGLMMGTRVGDIDPGAVMFLTSGAPNLPPARVYALLNEESGLLGVSGVSNDIRDVRRAAQHNRLCRLAIEMYAYRVTKYIGAYAAAMGGIDLVVFTGGIGENDYELRTLVCEGLGFMGIEIDERANRSTQGMQRDISSKDSRTRVLVVPSDEEVAIFRETIRVVATGASLGHGLGSKSKA